MADHRLPPHIIGFLEDAIQAASLTNASFDGFGKPGKVIVETSYGRTEHDGTVTEFIRDKVRLHHGSWIIAPLQGILRWSESHDDGSMREYDLMGRLTGPWPNPVVLKQAAEEVATLRAENAELLAFKRKVESAFKEIADAG